MGKHLNKVFAFIMSLMVFCTTVIPSELVLADSSGGESTPTVTYTSVHDPSIVVGYIDGEASGYTDTTTVYGVQNAENTRTKMYFIFGSHRAWSYSFDLMNWTTFENNINTKYNTIFAQDAVWSAKGGTQNSASGKYEVAGNLWAPDVVWNPTMNKWCMYMSVNGDYWYTTVVLLTADSLNGDWERQGAVVYSGFANATDAAATDYFSVKDTEGNSLVWDDRYIAKRNGSLTYGMNAIDPCVFYDNGDLWMAYGSWFGGIYMLKLDPTTGLRDYNTTYAYKRNDSDPYMGYHIAGGYHSSGEASYIEKIGDYYYLFMSYGGLVANGGYNMRVFRSKNVTGPYVDESGDDARFAEYKSNIEAKYGMRLMSYYKWNYMNYGFTAQGHNSQFVDDDGKIYVIYHTRTNDGSEGHSVRVHQMFVTEKGWLAAAPFEYTGETLTSEVEAADVAGSYEVLFQENTDHTSLVCNEGKTYTFAEDGTIQSGGSDVGTWAFSTAKDAPYVNMTINSKNYEGVFVEQYMETETAAGAPINVKREVGEKTMTFSVVGDASTETAVWGYKYIGDDATIALNALQALTVPTGTVMSLNLPKTCSLDTEVTWKSGNQAILSDSGVLNEAPAEATDVKMTAYTTYNGTTVSNDFHVTVYPSQNNEEELVLAKYFTDSPVDLSDAVQGDYSYPNPFNINNTFGLNTSNGVSIKFDVKHDGTSDQWLSDIICFNGGSKGTGLWFEGNSYLGYNATGGFMDANIQNGSFPGWGWGTNFINKSSTVSVELKILPTGFEVWADGVKAYDQSMIETYDANKTSYTIPGGYSSGFNFSSILSYLMTGATEMDLGWGSWWDGGYKGTISNLELSVLPVEVKDTSAYSYYCDFNQVAGTTGADTGFVSPNAASDLEVTYESGEYGFVLNFKENTTVSGGRSAYKDLGLNNSVSENYTFETDVKIVPGTVSVSCFEILGKDASSLKTNAATASNYILKLESTAKGSTTYKVNDDADTTVTIPSGTWTHITVAVDGDMNVYAKIGTEVIKTKANGNSSLYGVRLLRGRGSGYLSVDNIAMKDSFSCVHDSSLWTQNTTESTCASAGHIDNVCPTCGYTEVVKELPTKKHDYSTDVTAPTCTEAGYTTYTCKNCAYNYKGDEVAATGHQDTKVINAKEATCTKKGYSGDTYCNTCKSIIKNGTETEIKSHDYNTVVTAPTCTEEGYTTYTCKNCEYSYKDDEVAATGHQDTKLINVVEADCIHTGYSGDTYCNTCKQTIATGHVTEATGIHNYEVDASKGTATCTEGGSVYEYCRVCNDERVTENGEPLGHHWVVNKIIQSATCAEDGKAEYICDRDCCEGQNITKEDVIQATGEHTPLTAVEENRKEPTCVTDGSYDEVVYCRGCQGEISRTTKKIPATGEHQWDLGEVTTAATCTQEGVMTYHCLNCEATDTKAIDKKAHNITEATTVVTAPTCTVDGYTTYSCANEGCDYSYTGDVVKAAGHVYEDTVVPPTCVNQGYTIHQCKNCEENYKDTYVKPTGKHSYEETITTPATCTEDGVKTFTCTVCGDSYVIAIPCVGSHSYDGGKVTKEPTTEAEGEMTFTCETCGDSYIIAIEKLPDHKHIYSFIDNKDGTHVAKCSCGQSYTEAHKYNANGYCELCNSVKEIIPEHQHSLEYVDNEDGTHSISCTDCEYGIIENHSYNERDICKVCGSDKYAADIQDADPEIVELCNTAKGIQISWEAVEKADGYYIYRKVGKEGWKKVKTTSACSWTDTKALKNGEKYQYKICAYRNALESEESEIKTVYRLIKKNIAVLKNTKGKKIKIKWLTNAKGDGCQIQYSTSELFKSAKKVAVKGNKKKEKIISGLKKGKTYYVRIRIYKKVGKNTYYSEWSKTKKIKISK